MKRWHARLPGAVVACGGLVLAGCAANPPSTAPQAAYQVQAYEELRFLPPLSQPLRGTQIAVLAGDPATGPSTLLMRAGRGPIPLHVHTADYPLVVVRGIAKHWLQGESEAAAKPLGTRSWWFQPGGQPHADACLSDECVLLITGYGRGDGRLVKAQS